jgi:peroxiredoxin
LNILDPAAVFFNSEEPSKNTMFRLIHFTLMFLLAGWLIPAGAEPIPAGQPFPDLVLEFQQKESADYLGTPGKSRIRLSSIKAQGLIVSIYSLYCPPCHREAEHLNNLYRMMLERGIPLKIIGIAAGNSKAEVETYRVKNNVPFPLFEDPEYEFHDALGALPVPSFYVVSLQGETPKVALSNVGEAKDEEAFLKKSLSVLGIKLPDHFGVTPSKP